MATIKKIYEYFFFRAYEFWENASYPKFMSEWKASLTVDVFGLFIGFSALSYFLVVTGIHLDYRARYLTLVIYLIVVVLPNYFFFNHRDQWKTIVSKYRKDPMAAGRNSVWLVPAILLFTLVNFTFSIWLLAKVSSH